MVNTIKEPYDGINNTGKGSVLYQRGPSCEAQWYYIFVDGRRVAQIWGRRSTVKWDRTFSKYHVRVHGEGCLETGYIEVDGICAIRSKRRDTHMTIEGKEVRL